MARAPRPNDPAKMKKWAQAGWPGEPGRQKSEYDAGMAAINSARKDQQAQLLEAQRRASNTRAARGKK